MRMKAAAASAAIGAAQTHQGTAPFWMVREASVGTDRPGPARATTYIAGAAGVA